MREDIIEKAYAKINISLDVTARRDDGYHDMAMVMQTVSLCDDVRLGFTDGSRIFARTNLPFIPGDERNLAVRTAKKFFEAAGEPERGLCIRIDKRIPVGAGMAGGSTDAAAVLRGLNRAFGNRFGVERLEELGAEVGSDVAFCVRGGTMLARGRGELLTPLSPLPDCVFVICKPQFSISTPELFRKLDQVSLRRHPDTAGIVSALERANLGEVCRRMYNVFEDVNDRRMRTVMAIKAVLIDHGALGAVMTGTGSAVFGIFTDKAAAEAARDELKKDYGFCCLAVGVRALA